MAFQLRVHISGLRRVVVDSGLGVLCAFAVLCVPGCEGDQATRAADSAERNASSVLRADVSKTITTAIDAYGTDPSSVSGTRDEVCRGGAAANRPGRVKLAADIASRFPRVIDVQGYECREISDSSNPDCQGRREPDHSTCWSTHAAGRAIDVIVGGEPNNPTAEGSALGDEIVSDFLAAVDGTPHRLARITGVQEIIWNGHCWHPKDASVTRAAEMPSCNITGHANHVHLTLSDAGADASTSWYQE